MERWRNTAFGQRSSCGKPLNIFLILHAFATGCTALTGIEAISNGVPAFQPPEAKNAARTLIVMAILMAVLFLGSIGLTQFLGIVSGPQETILSALARRLLGNGSGLFCHSTWNDVDPGCRGQYQLCRFSSASCHSRCRWIPAAPIQVIWVIGWYLRMASYFFPLPRGSSSCLFGGDSHSFIPLFAVGVFLAFTLSQAGMVIHWWREHGKGWLLKATINGLGAVTTFITLFVVGITKFLEGAWVTVFLIPILMFMFLRFARITER